MILAIDVGNTHTVFGLFDDQDSIVAQWRLATRRERTEDEYIAVLQQLLALQNISNRDIHGLALASVVPQISGMLEAMNKRYINGDFFQIEHRHLNEFSWAIDDPREVGADRLCNILGASQKYALPLIVIDLGTAITIDVIAPGPRYLGGCISPGIETAISLFHAKTAQLPSVPLAFPEKSIGRNTREHMQSGVLFGSIALIDGLVRQMLDEAGFATANIVATGGQAGLISDRSTTLKIHDPHLTITGLMIAYRRHERE
jgi:type III pantothenate kinase